MKTGEIRPAVHEIDVASHVLQVIVKSNILSVYRRQEKGSHMPFFLAWDMCSVVDTFLFELTHTQTYMHKCTPMNKVFVQCLKHFLVEMLCVFQVTIDFMYILYATGTSYLPTCLLKNRMHLAHVICRCDTVDGQEKAFPNHVLV